MVIDTPLGKMRGIEHNANLAFRGIRFAKPPTGELRFKPPVPVDAWDGEYDATEFGPSAPQISMNMPDMPLQLPEEPTGEDCLFLNVYTPATDNARRPVLFWIHGGGYIVGSGRVYDGSVFTQEHDVVVVSVNYRMGALGFMHVGHLESELVSSVNNGILDQICALEWTRNNIAAFGGDPDNVMIFGESAGGTSTAMLLGCPQAEGLYHKAVVHSPHVDLIEVGSGHVDFTNNCIKRLGGDPDTNGMETLRNASAEQLAQLALPDFSNPNFKFEPSLGLRETDNVTFSPAIDGVLIPQAVAKTISARGSDNVPFMGGGCRHEGTLFPTVVGMNEFDEEGAIVLFEDSGCSDGDRALDVYENFAPGSTPREKLVYALTDTMFRNSMVWILDAAARSGAKCWSWMCTWESDLPGLRATHAIELTFIWGWISDPDLPAMQRFAGAGAPPELGKAMRAYWANFARDGVPSAEGEPDWQPYNADNRPVMLLDAERRMAHNFDDEVRQLWFEG
ncbi:MAG: carboxylesterase family protein [Pseudomonadota bacterium]